MKTYIKELFVYWKVFSLFIGIVLLSVGALVEKVPDWDIPLSIVMAILTYITAPFVVSNLFTRRFIFSFIVMWLVVDVTYVLYNTFAGNHFLRLENAYVSTLMYLMCGALWSLKGNLKLK